MVLHPKERKRLKRQKVKEAKRRDAAKFDQIGRLEDYYQLAADCHEDGDHAGALNWAVKILEARPSHDDAWHIAMSSARSLGDMDKCLSLLTWRWRAGQIGNWKERFSVGRFALERKDYRLASEIFESVLKDPFLNSGRNEKKHFKDVEAHLRYAQAMLQPIEFSEQKGPTAQGGRSRSRSGGTAAGARSGISTPPTELGPSEPTGAVPAAAQCQPVCPAVVEALPEVKIEYATNADLVIEAIRKSRQADRGSFG